MVAVPLLSEERILGTDGVTGYLVNDDNNGCTSGRGLNGSSEETHRIADTKVNFQTSQMHITGVSV